MATQNRDQRSSFRRMASVAPNVFTKLYNGVKLKPSKKYDGKTIKQMYDKYRITKKVLGAGQFSQVKLAFDHEEGKSYAVKILNKEGKDPLEIKKIIREVKLIQSLRAHPNIVKFYDFYEDENAVYVFMEHASGGELFDEIEARERFTEKDAKETVHLLAAALKFCHDKGVVHRDIKPDNILLQDTEHGKNVKLADFGFATRVEQNTEEFDTLQTRCGTPNYVAPEIIQGNPYNYKCDIWSLGVVIYVMLSGYLPFGGRTQKQLFNNICKGEFAFEPAQAWENVSMQARKFIRKLVTVDRDARYNYEQILRDPWMTSLMEGDENDLSGNIKQLKAFNQQRKALAATKAYEAAVIFEELMGKSISGFLETDDPKDIERFQDAMDEDVDEIGNLPVRLSASRRKMVGNKDEGAALKKQAFRNGNRGKTSFASFWRAARQDEKRG